MRFLLPITQVLCLLAWLLAGAAPGLCAADVQTARNPDLARVGIAPFANADQNADYEWVETSLPEAISSSMHARFEFISQDEKLVESAFRAHYQKSEQLTAATARRIARDSQSDILIIGRFRIDRTRSEITMQAVIYQAQTGNFIGEVEQRSEVSNRIFKQIDTMAADIVSAMYRYALQANASGDNLRMLVLVPSFTTQAEKLRAEAELSALKAELERQEPGNYLTLFEFFTRRKVAQAEQDKALQLALSSDRNLIKRWLAGYGVNDAYLIFVRGNKVNITAVSPTKIAQVTYAVSASTEEKQQAMRRAQSEVRGKTALPREEGPFPGFLNVHLGLGLATGMLESGNRIGVIGGPVVHASVKVSRYLQPQVRFEGFYGVQRGELAGIWGASAFTGLGYTTGTKRWSLTPYATGGVFAARVARQLDAALVLLPAVSAGLLYTWNLRREWGLSLSLAGQYVVDPAAPALFFSGTLAWVARL